MNKLMIGVAAAALLSVPVLAFQGHGMMGMKEAVTRAEVQAQVKEHFSAADTNKDGFLVQSELDAAKQARMKERMDRHFAELDSNKDGNVSRAEFDAHHQQKMAARMEHRKDGGPMGGNMMMRHGGMGHGKMDHMMSMETLDTSKDGKISLDEVSAKPLAMFDMADSNKDGTISPDERRAARAAMWEKWRAAKGTDTPADDQAHQH